MLSVDESQKGAFGDGRREVFQLAQTIEAGRHHFDVIEALTDPGSALVAALVGETR